MAKFKIVEETIAYKEYWIEANSFEEARWMWENNESEVDDASYNARWDISDMVELNCIENEKGEIEWYN